MSPEWKILPFRNANVIVLGLLCCVRMFSEFCPRPGSGSVIETPPEVTSSNGKLDVEFQFRASAQPDGRIRYCYIDANGDESPTLRVRPGDTVILKLKNELPPAHAMSGSSTNLHFHGLDIPPKRHQDDVLHTMIEPSDPVFEYRFKIPVDEPPGLYWYHPHPHGFSEAQVLGGASGALIVEGAEGLPERLLVLRDEDLPAQHTKTDDDGDAVGKDVSVNFVPVRFPLYLPAIMRVEANEKELWRILNASADTYFDLQVIYVENGQRVAQKLQLTAIDGYPVGKRAPKDVTHVLIPAGGRAEFILTTPRAGAFAQLVSRDYDTGRDGARNPGHVIANIVSKAVPLKDPVSGATPAPPADLSDAVSSRIRKLYFSEDRQDLKDPTKPARYFITVEGREPAVFDMHFKEPDITVQQGAVEDWTIENRANEAHVFHIHQLHFQVIARDGRKVDGSILRDTIDLPAWDGKSAAYPSVTLRMDFRNPAIVGTFLYHCHILEHEDAGMMGSIQVVTRTHK